MSRRRIIDLENVKKVSLILEAPNGETKRIPIDYSPTISSIAIGKTLLSYDKIHKCLVLYERGVIKFTSLFYLYTCIYKTLFISLQKI